MNPGEHAGQVHGPDRRPAEAVVDDEPGQQQEGDLQAEPSMPPAQEAAQQRDSQDIEGRRARPRARLADDGQGNRPGTVPWAGLGTRRGVRPTPRGLGGTEQEPDADHEERHQVRQRAGHPHQDAGRRLIVERRTGSPAAAARRSRDRAAGRRTSAGPTAACSARRPGSGKGSAARATSAAGSDTAG